MKISENFEMLGCPELIDFIKKNHKNSLEDLKDIYFL